MTTRTLLIITLATLAHGRVQKEEVIFRGEHYNITTGCPSKNPEVLRYVFVLYLTEKFKKLFFFFRWHQFCTALWGGVAVCSNKGLGVKRHLVPKYRCASSKLHQRQT